ncbi:MAG TPA: ATP-grasp domain-containing protein [Bacteroidia bacterium]|jgi:hypothetical protein|nr:ATP-grasp domain-containing protein [Bacteroidia bacterium]
MSQTKVLIFPAGEINSIELHDALASCVNIKLYGASSFDRHGEYVFENYISGVPLINAPDFFEKFNALLEEKEIDLIFPTHDTVATFFADNAHRISAKIVAADKATSAVCRDKEKTYALFKDCDFTPKTYPAIDTFPVFIKPKEGQGSVGARLIKNEQEIPDFSLAGYVICEYLPGEEYTVDCITDKNGKLAFASPRSRQRIMAGVSVAGKTEQLTPEIQHIAQTLNERLGFSGLWWFQIKKDIQGKWKLLEISTRCAGTMCLTRARGVNLPLLSVYTALGYDIQIEANSYEVIVDRTLISRYKINYAYEYVYFDFDDTLIVNNKVHLKAIWFLYQCRNAGKQVILITKHEKDLAVTMKNFAIPGELFCEIIHLKPEETKADHIKHHSAIFIDNAYQERKSIARRHGIPVFDVDGLDVLLDWRN